MIICDVSIWLLCREDKAVMVTVLVVVVCDCVRGGGYDVGCGQGVRLSGHVAGVPLVW